MPLLISLYISVQVMRHQSDDMQNGFTSSMKTEY